MSSKKFTLVLAVSLLAFHSVSGELHAQASSVEARDTTVTELSEHLGWCMKIHTNEAGQQGIYNFLPGSDELRDLEVLRKEYEVCQSHNFAARQLIQFSSEVQFERALYRALAEIEEYVTVHLEWVAYSRERAYDLVEAAERGDALEIRQIYEREQSAHPEARSNLKAVSDAFLVDIARRL